MQKLVEKKFSKSWPKWDVGIDSGSISSMYHFSIKDGGWLCIESENY